MYYHRVVSHCSSIASNIGQLQLPENPVEMTENPNASCEKTLKMKDMTLC